MATIEIPQEETRIEEIKISLAETSAIVFHLINDALNRAMENSEANAEDVEQIFNTYLPKFFSEHEDLHKVVRHMQEVIQGEITIPVAVYDRADLLSFQDNTQKILGLLEKAESKYSLAEEEHFKFKYFNYSQELKNILYTIDQKLAGLDKGRDSSSETVAA